MQLQGHVWSLIDQSRHTLRADGATGHERIVHTLIAHTLIVEVGAAQRIVVEVAPLLWLEVAEVPQTLVEVEAAEEQEQELLQHSPRTHRLFFLCKG